jgi:hypothetical protein
MNNAGLEMTTRPWIPRASFLVLAALLIFSILSGGRTSLAERKAIIFQGDSLNLQQNFPNPFPYTTTILYGVAEAGVVEIKVYNTLGQEILTPVDEEKEPGAEILLHLDMSAFPSGQYTYVMTFISDADGTKTKLIKRMQLIR